MKTGGFRCRVGKKGCEYASSLGRNQPRLAVV